MSSKTLCGWVRVAAVAVAVCFLLLLGFIIPVLGSDITAAYPEFKAWYLPWLAFLWAAALPCFVVLVFVWKVSAAIKNEEVFTLQTAKWIKNSAILLFCDVGFFFAGNVVFLLLGMSHPGVLLSSLLVEVLGIALALAAAVLARYITKAALLQEESDGTI